MKRLFSLSLITLALLIGAAGVAPAAHAQFYDQFGTSYPTQEAADAASAANAAASTAANTQGGLNADGSLTPQQYADTFNAQNGMNAQQAINQAASKPATGDAKPDDAYGSVMQWILKLFAWLVGAAALTLNYAVHYTVVTMGSYVKNLSAIGATWTILRDIGNIFLIFGFLAVGVTTILNVDWYGKGTKMLPMMFVAAVFLNFSLFISEAVIDTGNLFATQFYSQINGGSIALSSVNTGSFSELTSIASTGIAGKLLNQLGLQTLYGDAASQGTTKLAIYSGPNAWLVGFMGIILFIVTAFVMFALAFILIARFVILIFLIILSPIGFAGLAVPMLAKRAGQWWEKLFEQTITAPILLLMLYIALRVITDAQFLTGFNPSAIAGAASTGFIDNTNLAGFASFLLSFIVAMGLLIVVIIQSKNLSAFGASWASKAAGALSFGAVSLGGRATLGMLGVGLANKRMQSLINKGDKKAASIGGLGGFALRGLTLAGKGVVLGGKGLRSSAYDVRNVPGAAAGLGAMGVDAGKGATITAKQVHDAQYGVKPVREFFQHSAEERNQAEREIDFNVAQRAIEKERADLAAGTITQAQYDTNVAPHEKVITDALSKMSTKQLEELSGIKKGTDALVDNLSPQQFEALMKSDKLNDVEKGKIKDARYRTLTSAIASGNAPAVKKAVNALSKGELESMPTATLTNPLVLDQLSDKQRDTITDSKERTAAEKDVVRKSSPVGRVEDIFERNGGVAGMGAASVAISPDFARLTTAQLAKLKKDILLQPAIAERLTSATLVKLQDENKLTPAEMITIGNHIRASATANVKTKDYVTTGPGAALWS